MLPTRVAISEESGSTPIRTEIEPLLDQIDHAIDEEQPGSDLRESVEKPNHDGHDMRAAEHGWCSDGNVAARLIVLTGKGELRRLEL